MTRWVCAAMVVVLAAAAAGQGRRPPVPAPKGGSMEQEFDVRNPTEQSIDRMADRIRDRGQLGIHVLGPRSLAIDRDDNLPVAVFDFYSAPERGQAFLSDNGVIVATRVEGRETYAALMKTPKEPVEAPEAGANPPAPITPGRIVKRFTLTVRERLPKMPWKAGTYIVDILLGGEASNRLLVPVTPGEAAAKDPAIAGFLEQQRPGNAVPAIWPAEQAGQPYPSYRPEPETPAIPAQEGIQLAAERVQIAGPEHKSILRGSFRLTVPARFAASVPVTLIILGNLSTGPTVLRLFVPTTDKAAPSAQVTGVFNIDLFRLRDTPRQAQTYTVYAYCGEVRSGPLTLAYVTPAMMRD